MNKQVVAPALFFGGAILAAQNPSNAIIFVGIAFYGLFLAAR